MLKKRKMCPTVIMHADLIVFRLNGEILDFPGAYKEVSRDLGTMNVCAAMIINLVVIVFHFEQLLNDEL